MEVYIRKPKTRREEVSMLLIYLMKIFMLLLRIMVPLTLSTN